MARKENTVVLKDGDQELKIKIRQMSARHLYRWVGRAFFLAAGAGIEVPEGVSLQDAGRFLLALGLPLIGKLSFEGVEPLAEELLSCCSIVIDKFEKKLTMDVVDDHIQDFQTIYKLQYAALELNFGFSEPEAGAASGFLKNGGSAAPSRA